MKIKFTLNQEVIEHEVAPNKTLVNMLREDFDLTGAKEGCGGGECGSCTILFNGKPVTSCLMLGVQADGQEITTIEGLSQGNELDELQKTFISTGALQCGYCTPGMILTAKGLLSENPDPTREEIKTALSGNLCRCTGYKRIIEAVEQAAKHYR
ncbi:(2Fe-2S)-binding protein [Isachenkonia alkalipeptolytica]|uniref:(2Fe-2S)-binding protein n=1 Tax=Isachenkonia alkalipeptolytica TaxID=2565777 RepID=A0AA43XMN8_9CLOT|nr:(2Fe-2S)-binding protein [Isachenkonia alkalipeptolytica]NBG89251.1 (2Fe-2S)-binding protein [Isachenkonia alkalipeptolytica]